MNDYSSALKYAFLLLKYRPRSTQEITDRLANKQYSRQVIKKVLAHLIEHRFIDDGQFARLFVSSSSSKGWGKRKIAYALHKLGVPKDLSAQALNDDSYYRSRLSHLIEKKLEKLKGQKSAYPKLMRYLASKGFEYNEIAHALQEFKIDIYDNR